MKDHLKYTYDSAKRDELEKKHREESVKKDAEAITANPYGRKFMEDRGKHFINTQEFASEQNYLVSHQRKVFKLIKESGLFDRFLNEAQKVFIDGQSLRVIANDSLFLMVACVMADVDKTLLNKIHGEVSVFYFENGLVLVSSEGVEQFPYKKNVQEQVDEVLSSQENLDEVVPLSREIQLEAMRAHAQPTVEDKKAQEDFRNQYGLQLVGTKNRDFSKYLVSILDTAVSGLPVKELKNIKGFCFVTVEQRMKMDDGKKDLMMIDENILAQGARVLRDVISLDIAGKIINRNNKLFEDFMKASGWKGIPVVEPKAVLKRLAIKVRYKLGGSSIDTTEYINDSNADSSFLFWTCRAHPRLDFSMCYKWFLLNNEEFKRMAEKDGVLKRKYDFFARYFKRSGSAD